MKALHFVLTVGIILLMRVVIILLGHLDLQIILLKTLTDSVLQLVAELVPRVALRVIYYASHRY
jgi:hypothetical protein